MAFVYEAIKPEDYELAESLGLRDVLLKPLHTHHFEWCKDTERHLFLVDIGTFRFAPPHYFDFYYKDRIIRLEVESSINRQEDGVRNLVWNVKRISIPKSIWLENDIVMELIKDAFLADDLLIRTRGEDCNISVNLPNEAEVVEVDYNGK